MPETLADRSEFRQAGIKMAMVKAMETALEKIEADIPEGAYSNGINNILENTKDHVKIEESETESEAVYREYLADELQKRFGLIHTHFNKASADNSTAVPLEWMESYIACNLMGKKEGSIKRNINRHYEEFFKIIRRRAVERQGARLIKQISLDEADVDRIATSVNIDEQKRKIAILKYEEILRKPLLEELYNNAYALAENVIATGLDQYKIQSVFVKGYEPPDSAISAEQIKKSFELSLKNHLQNHPNISQEEKRYGLFPSLNTKIEQLSVKYEKDRFVTFVTAYRKNFNNKSETIKKEIGENLSDHEKYRDSLNIYSERYKNDFANSIVVTYKQNVILDEEGKQFESRLQTYLANEKMSITVKNALDESLAPVLGNIRSSIAEQQVIHHFNFVITGDWCAPEKMLVDFIEDKGSIDINSYDEFISHSNKHDLFGKKSTNFNPKNIIEETKDLVLARSKAFLGIARNAWNGQNNLLDSKRSVLTEEATSKKANGVALNQIIEDLKLNFQQKWKNDHDNTLRKDITQPSGYLVSDNDNLLLLSSKLDDRLFKLDKYIRKNYIEVFNFINEKIAKLVNEPPQKKDPLQTFVETMEIKVQKPQPKIIVRETPSDTPIAPGPQIKQKDTGKKEEDKQTSGPKNGTDKKESLSNGTKNKEKKDGNHGENGGRGLKGMGQLFAILKKVPVSIWLLLLILLILIIFIWLLYRWLQRRPQKTSLGRVLGATIRLLVKDVDKTIAFYKKFEGIKIERNSSNPDRAKLQIGSLVIELNTASSRFHEEAPIEFVFNWHSKSDFIEQLGRNNIKVGPKGECRDPNGFRIINRG